MDEPNLDPALHHPVLRLQKRHHIPTTGINVHVLDICSRNPQPFSRLRQHSADDRLVDIAVGEEDSHNISRLIYAASNDIDSITTRQVRLEASS